MRAIICNDRNQRTYLRIQLQLCGFYAADTVRTVNGKGYPAIETDASRIQFVKWCPEFWRRGVIWDNDTNAWGL